MKLKTLAIAFIITSSALKIFAADSQSHYSVIEQGIHYRVWDAVLPDETHTSFTELQSGLNYEENGEWLQSQEIITAGLDGAEAVHGAHKVHFPANITDKPVETTLPGGAVLKTKVLGLAYYDTASGKSVLIAELKDSVGELMPSRNELVYGDAFTDIEADIRFTYRRSGLEQDVIFRRNLPPPSDWGLDTDRSRLGVLTEVFDPPATEVKHHLLFQEANAGVRRNLAEPDITDDYVDFGPMQFGTGKAFVIAGQNQKADATTIPVFKTWSRTGARTILFEEIRYQEMKPLLAKLPAMAALESKPAARTVLARTQFLKTLPLSKTAFAARSKRPISLATVTDQRPGVVADWTLLSSATNFTFVGTTTYFVSGNVSLAGTNTVIEGGTVVKFTNTSNVQITFNTPITCQAAPYNPAVWTSKDDDGVGQKITGSTGAPSGYYGNGLVLTTNSSLSNLRFAYLNTALSINSFFTLNLADSQFLKDYVGIYCSLSNNVVVENALFATMDHIVERGPVTFAGTQITADQISAFGSLATGGTNSFLNLTNTLLSSVGAFGFLAPDSPPQNINEDSDGNVNSFGRVNDGPAFQTIGAGAHYLAYNSPHRDQGTTNISSALLARLSQKTTYAPVLYPLNYVFSTNTMFGPVVPRDDDTPDRGYHYDPLDFCLSKASVTNSTLTITNGAAVAVYGIRGFSVQNGGKVVSQGDASHVNHLVRYNSVQEGPAIWTTNSTTMSIFDIPSSTTSKPQVTLRFTDVSFLGAGPSATELIYIASVPVTFAATDCSFRGAYIYEYAGPSAVVSIALTNNFFQRSQTDIYLGYAGVAFNASGYFFNNTFQNGLFTIYYAGGSCGVYDNYFDASVNTITQAQPIPGFYNAFKGGSSSFGSNNVFLTIDDYQTGPLGPLYYPTSGVSGGLTNLFNKGSRTAAAAGLSTYTTTTNQVADSGTVDIGYHYFALNTNAVVTIFASSPIATEDGVINGEFTISRSGATTASLNVPYTIGGLAINGTDYATISSMATIPAGSSSTNVTITPIDDALVEFNETVSLTLVLTNTYMLGGQSSATVTIQDNDEPSLTNFASPNHPVAIDFQNTSGKYIVSLNGDVNDHGLPNNFDTMTTSGTLATFSGFSGLPSEVKLTTVKSTANGFTNGDIYFTGAQAGQIGLLTANGTQSNATWVTIAGETNTMRGGLWVDQTGVFGGDLIAISGGNPNDINDTAPAGGAFYRITSAGVVTKINQITKSDGTGVFLEGLLTITNDFSRYGPWAGRAVAGAEQTGMLFTVGTTTNAEQVAWNFSMVPEDIDIITPGLNCYVNDFGTGNIKRSASSAFAQFPGDVAVLEEKTLFATESALMVAHWTGGYWVIRKLFSPGGIYENATFGP